jgi:hypothetical protein
MATTFKAGTIAHELADRLKVRALGVASAVTESVDSTDSNPTIQIGTLASTNRCALIKVKPVDWPLAKDILGLSQPVFTPHVIQVLIEAAPLGGLTTSDKLDLFAQLASMGTIVEIYETASGGFVSANLGDSTKLKETYHPDQWHQLVSAQ